MLGWGEWPPHRDLQWERHSISSRMYHPDWNGRESTWNFWRVAKKPKRGAETSQLVLKNVFSVELIILVVRKHQASPLGRTLGLLQHNHTRSRSVVSRESHLAKLFNVLVSNGGNVVFRISYRCDISETANSLLSGCCVGLVYETQSYLRVSWSPEAGHWSYQYVTWWRIRSQCGFKHLMKNIMIFKSEASCSCNLFN